MRKEDFTYHLKNPEQLTGEDLQNLEDILDHFPYCQSVHLLQLVAVKRNKSAYFDQKLHKTAIYAADRKALHQLIADTETHAKEKVPEQVQEKLHKEDQQHKTQATSHDIDASPLDREILKEAVNQSYELEMQQEEVATELQTQRQTSSAETEEKKDEPLSFTAWLSGNKNEVVHQPHANQASKDKLIDNFIERESTAIQPTSKSSFFSPTKAAKKSLNEDDTLVTETLAHIYVQQGEYGKAMAAFETLSLKYPEKSSYFALHLKKIEELVNKK